MPNFNRPIRSNPVARKAVKIVYAISLFALVFNYSGAPFSTPVHDSPNALAASGISVSKYDQCSNDDGDGYATGDTGCRWTNGNLQKNNSTYVEGEATVQRLLLTGVENGPHTLTIQYGTTKQGKHAYDYLTDDRFSESWVTDADFCEGLTGFSSCSSITPSLSPDIPADPNVNGFDAANAYFRIRNGSITSVGTPTLVNGDYTGDSETSIELTFNVDSSTCLDSSTHQNVTSCPVLITWGAHISSSLDWSPEPTAVNIPGSPYHVAIDAIDGESVGQRDNQMQAGAVVPDGNITIVKETIPDGSTEVFTFDGSDDTLDGNLSDGQTIVASLAPDTYTISETDANSNGWSLTDITCEESDTQNSSGDISTGDLTLVVEAGEVVTCVFTNTRDTGDLKVVKLDQDQQPMASVGFTIGNDPYVTDVNGEILVQDLETGVHNIEESEPAGYTWASVSGANCTNSNPSTATVLKETTTTCTFTNTRDTGTITVNKYTDADGDGVYESDSDKSNLLGFAWGIASDDTPYAFGTQEDFETGNYVVYENNVPNYHFVGWFYTNREATCDIGSFDGTSLPASLQVTKNTNAEITLCNMINPEEPTSPELTITKDVDSLETTAGGDVEYTVVVTNIGDGTALDVVLDDTLDEGFTFASNGQQTNSWNLGDIAPGDSVTTVYTVNVDTNAVSKSYKNIAVANASNADPVDDTATVLIPAVLGVDAIAQLVVEKSVLLDIANPGATVGYTVNVTNIGEAVAVNVVLTDTLPDGFVHVTTGETTATWNLGDLLPGETTSVTYDVTVGNVEPGDYENLARATADNSEPAQDTAEVEIRLGTVLGVEDELPRSGGDALLLLIIAAFLAASGSALITVARRPAAVVVRRKR